MDVHTSDFDIRNAQQGQRADKLDMGLYFLHHVFKAADTPRKISDTETLGGRMIKNDKTVKNENNNSYNGNCLSLPNAFLHVRLYTCSFCFVYRFK